MSRNCPNCGATAVSDDARYCHQCGTSLDVESATEPQPGQPPPAPPSDGTAWRPAQHPSGLSSEVRNWAMAAHLSAFIGAWVALAFVGPLVVWLFRREEHPFIEEHAREALNFNLTLLIYLVVGFLLAFVIIGIPLLIAVGITWLVVTITASVRASNGESYRYPFTIRFVS